MGLWHGKNKDTRIISNYVGLAAWPGAFVANFECLLSVEKLNGSGNWSIMRLNTYFESSIVFS